MSLRRSHMRCDEYRGSYMTGHFIWNVKYYTRPNDGTWKKTDNKCSRQPAHMQWIQKSAYYIGKQCRPRCGVSSGSSLLAWKKHQFILKCNKPDTPNMKNIGLGIWDLIAPVPDHFTVRAPAAQRQMRQMRKKNFIWPDFLSFGANVWCILFSPTFLFFSLL